MAPDGFMTMQTVRDGILDESVTMEVSGRENSAE
jgi:hypothetical protein